MKKTNQNFVEVTQVVPTYRIDNINVYRVVKYLFSPGLKTCSNVVLQSSSGSSVIEFNKGFTFSSTLPMHNDSIDDDSVYELFANKGFDEEATIDEFHFWGIDKVYYTPYCGKVLGIDEFLSRVKEYIFDQNESYYFASLEDKNCIFKKWV